MSTKQRTGDEQGISLPEGGYYGQPSIVGDSNETAHQGVVWWL